MPSSNFAQQIAPTVIANCLNTGVFPSVVIAQAIEESGSGTSKIAQMFNNLFGHMANANWTGKKGQTTPHGNFWRWYSSISDCIAAHIVILKKPKYQLSGVTRAKTPFEQAQALQLGGYNTGPDKEQYAAKLAHIIKSYNLQQYDSMLFAQERRINKNGLAYYQQPALSKMLNKLFS